MKAKNALVGFGMVAALFGAAAGAEAAIPLAKYMAAPDRVEDASPGNPSKGDIVAAVYKAYAKHYSQNDPATGECMVNAYLAKTENGGSRLNGIVKSTLEQTAKRPDAGGFIVESVIESVIKSECGIATSTPQKSGRSN